MRAEIPAERVLMLQKSHPEVVAEHFEIIQTGPTQVAIVSFDGDPKHLVLPNSTRAFWKTLTKVDVERVETADNFRVSKDHLNKVDLSRTPVIVSAVVEAYEAALLIVDGELREKLKPGRHAFWAVGRTVRLPKIDLRPQPLEVTAQEILTKDRVAHPGDADRLLQGDRPGRGRDQHRRSGEHHLPAGAVRHPRGRGDAHAR